MTQDKALEILKSGRNVFLTGEPGAGKSYTINLFTEYLRSMGRYADVTASTGIAATHINGQTIHSWSGIGIKDKVTEKDIDQIMKKSYVIRRILSAQVLIIDEISMLNGDAIDSVDKVCRAVRGSAEFMTDTKDKPFGGLQVIFVGDFFQLPPIKSEKFAFQSNAWLAADPRVCYLDEQHRQSDEKFLDLLKSLRDGKIEKRHIAILKSRNIPAPEGITRLFTHNRDVDHVNTQELAKLDGEKRTYHMGSSGIDFLIATLKKNCLSPERLDLKIGAKVMFTRNERRNKDRDFEEPRYVNGTMGKIISMDDGRVVVLTKEGIEIEAIYEEWVIEEKDIRKAMIKQIPLRLAYAITVHKCQGMSLDSATMDLGSAFEYGQGYVALSRVRSLEGLYLEGLNKMALEMHPTVIKKDGMFRSISKAAI